MSDRQSDTNTDHNNKGPHKLVHYSTKVLSKHSDVLIENAQVQARWKVEELKSCVTRTVNLELRCFYRT